MTALPEGLSKDVADDLQKGTVNINRSFSSRQPTDMLAKPSWNLKAVSDPENGGSETG